MPKLTGLREDSSLLGQLSDNETDLIEIALNDLESETKKLEDLSHAIPHWIQGMLTRELLAALFFCFCFAAYLGVGPTVLRVEYWKPWVPVVARVTPDSHDRDTREISDQARASAIVRSAEHRGYVQPGLTA